MIQQRMLQFTIGCFPFENQMLKKYMIFKGVMSCFICMKMNLQRMELFEFYFDTMTCARNYYLYYMLQVKMIYIHCTCTLLILVLIVLILRKCRRSDNIFKFLVKVNTSLKFCETNFSEGNY